MRPKGILERLARAGALLASPASLDDSLANIASLVADGLAAYCRITVSLDALERGDFSAEAGQRFDEGGETAVESLAAARRTFGRLECWTPSERFEDDAREAIHLLGLQLSIAIAAHEAVQREHRIADRFQRALLPDRLPEVDGIEFTAAYRPASAEADVGGDWYDAFLLPDGRVAISIGDVAGHGLDAAVIMGEVRQAMRTAAVAAKRPSEVLEYVNGALRLRASIGMVTAIFGLYDPRTSVLSYAVAGHPPPVLACSNGFVRQLPIGGLPFGCAPVLGSTDWTFTIPEDAVLVLYTDGMIENDRDLERGEAQLSDAIREIAAAGASCSAEALQERVFRGVPNRDDAAVLTIRRCAAVSRFAFSAVPITAALSRAVVGRALEALPLAEERRYGALVAVNEAVTNAIEHGYRDSEPGLIRLTIDPEASGLRISVEDDGRWKPFSRQIERGRGIELMHAFSDGVVIRSSRNRTAVVLRIAAMEETHASESFHSAGT